MTDTAKPAATGPLRRLFPLLKPILPRLVGGLISSLAASIVALLIPQMYQMLINSALSPGAESSGILLAAGVVFFLGILEAAFIALRRFFVIGPATTVETRMRTSFYRQLQQLSIAFHDRWGSGQLLSRSMADLSLFRRWLAFGAIMLLVTSFTVIAGTILMFTLSWVLALIFVAAAVPVIINGFRFRRYYRQISRKSQDQAGDLATVVEESVHGIRILKAFGRSQEALSSFSQQAEELRGTEISKARSLALFSLVVTLLPELALGAGLIVGIVLVTTGELTIGGLVAFFATAAVVAGPVESIGPLLAMALSSRTALDRYFEVMDTPPEITSPTSLTSPAKTAEPTSPASSPRSPHEPRGRLELDQLRFHYPGATEDVLHGVDLTIEPGETMALVGVTGSGKSTLLHLIPRLYEASSGSIRIDGADIRELPLETLRSMVSVAFEDTILFSASVRDNVLLGIGPDDSFGETEPILREALDIAQAGFADDLPQGLDTTIGEQGLSLSGGQRQRLALARAIAAKPLILVLDDPLSALDVTTEERVETRLREALEGTTTLIVAHRPSTVALADRVALLHEGRISAVGTHAELIAGNAQYRHVLASLDEETEGVRP